MVHQSPNLSRYGCRSRVICVGMLTGSAGCSTPVPQPLSVMNSVKANDDERLMVGEGMSGVKSGVLAPSFLRVMSLVMIVSIGMSCCFGGKGFLPFGILAYKYGFQNR